MPLKLEVSVMQVGSSLRITIPKQVAAHLGLKKGDIVLISVDNGHAILEKKAPVWKITSA
jgi:AbrB family looped-hinge helix DNA binding protein